MQVGVEVLEDANDARRLRAKPVGGDRHPVHLERNGQFAGKVGHDHDRTAQDAHQQDLAARVVRLDLPGEFRDLRVDLFLGEKRAAEVVRDVAEFHVPRAPDEVTWLR